MIMIDRNTDQLDTTQRGLPTPVVTSSDLMKGSKALIIRHGDNNYRLHVTRSQKFILTK